MGNIEDNSGPQSQVFSIGATMLHASTLQDLSYLYDIKDYRFNYEEGRKILDEWRQNTVYSEIYTALVYNLCSYEPQKRLTDSELWEWINRYD